MRKRTGPIDGTVPAHASAATLVRGLEILRTFRKDDGTLGNQDLIERTGLPKATVSRLTQTLVALGYLHYHRDLGRYSIGPATVALGYGALRSSPVVHLARPLMQRVAEETGAAVALGMIDGLDVVYLASCRSLSPVSLRLSAGSRIPLWRTAMGLALLADMEEARRRALLARLVEREPDEAGRIRPLVEAACAGYGAQGFVGVFGAWYSYINAVGVPVRPDDGSPPFALTCGGIVDILPRERCLREIGPRVLQLRDDLARAMDGRGGDA